MACIQTFQQRKTLEFLFISCVSRCSCSILEPPSISFLLLVFMIFCAFFRPHSTFGALTTSPHHFCSSFKDLAVEKCLFAAGLGLRSDECRFFAQNEMIIEKLILPFLNFGSRKYLDFVLSHHLSVFVSFQLRRRLFSMRDEMITSERHKFWSKNISFVVSIIVFNLQYFYFPILHNDLEICANCSKWLKILIPLLTLQISRPCYPFMKYSINFKLTELRNFISFSCKLYSKRARYDLLSSKNSAGHSRAMELVHARIS